MPRSLVVKVTAGSDAPERCSQGFTVAATAALADVDISLWLVGEAAWLAIPGRAERFVLPFATPMAELLGTVLESGTVTVCTQCAQRRGIEPAHLIGGIRIGGTAGYLEEILRPGAQAVVY